MRLEQLLPEKSPPPGGWRRLKARLDRIESGNRVWRPLRFPLLGGLAAVLLLTVWFFLPRAKTPPDYRNLLKVPDISLTMLGLQAPDGRQPVSVANPDLVLVPIAADAEVVIYQLVRPTSSALENLREK